MQPGTYHQMRKIEDGHWWYAARRGIIRSLLRSLVLPPQAEILEVGCGTGGNLRMLADFGNVTGMEPDGAAAQMARDRNVASVLFGKLPNDFPRFSRQFDLIALFDVIEHVEEDGESLQALSAILKPGGRIILTVPAFLFLWSQHDEDNQHFRRYHRRYLEELIRQCGFSLDYVSYFNFWLFPLVAAIRLIRKRIPYRKIWGDMRQPHERANRIMQSLLGSERHIIGTGTFPFGVSLIAVISSRK